MSPTRPAARNQPPQTRTRPRTCVIGAGSSGIAAAKELHQRGIPFDCFELGDRVGGNWVFRNTNGVSSSYKSLHINTSRERMEYSDYPMPKSYPDFPRHDHIARYFDDYVDHFGFRDDIHFGIGVDHVGPRDDGRFDIRLTDGTERIYTHVVVCNGHHWDMRWPEPAFPGSDTFEGEQIHSHQYEEEGQLAGKDIVVLGVGNSGMDIAVDASYHAQNTYLAHRRGAHVIPKYLFGKPIDQIGGSERLPGPIRFWLMGLMVKLAQGKMEDYGLKKPDHKLGHAHPTISGRILDRLSHGAIIPKPNIASLGKDTVRFDDGSEVHADLVVYCTGYRITFPFFDPRVLRRSRQPDQPLQDDVPAARRRTSTSSAWSSRSARSCRSPSASRSSSPRTSSAPTRCPSRPEMENEIAARQQNMAKRYVRSKRHTIQVDYDDYMKELRLEIERGNPLAVV